MRNVAISISISALVLLTGCARSKITTQIRADGTWARTVELTGQEKQPGMDMAPSLDEVFVIPSGEGWKSREEKKESDRTVILDRTMAAGATLKGDLSLKGDGPDKLSLVNEVTVTRLAPRRFEYKETLRWAGPPPDNMGDKIKPEDLAHIKAALPKSLATDANAHAVADKTGRLVIPLLFGPGDPLLALGMMHPDLAARRASQRVGTLLMKSLEDQFGDKMSPAERRETARKLLESAFDSAKPSKPDPSAGPPSKGKSSGLTSLMFVVKTPGKIVSTNGETDTLTGEVFWALFPEAASLDPVVMTAVVEIGN